MSHPSILYLSDTLEEKVNEAQKQLFSQKRRPMDGFPPTRAGLMKYTKRATYQAGRAQMFVPVPKLPSPGECGWLQINNGGWEVKWPTPRLLMPA